MTPEKIDSLFRFAHLPEDLQEVSKPFHGQAQKLTEILPQSAELTLCLRALWEAKNLAVFAFVEAKDTK